MVWTVGYGVERSCDPVSTLRSHSRDTQATVEQILVNPGTSFWTDPGLHAQAGESATRDRHPRPKQSTSGERCRDSSWATPEGVLNGDTEAPFPVTAGGHHGG